MVKATNCLSCGGDGIVYCPKCKTSVCAKCHRPLSQIYCELCHEKLPKHKTDCYNKMEEAYKKLSDLPRVESCLAISDIGKMWRVVHDKDMVKDKT